MQFFPAVRFTIDVDRGYFAHTLCSVGVTRFPLFTAVHQICSRKLPVNKFVDCLLNHPVHI